MARKASGAGKTRKGPKKVHAFIDAAKARELLEVLRQTQCLPQHHRALLLGAHQPECGPERPCNSRGDNQKANPNCFCGLLPAEGSYRKKGLWQKKAEECADLGPDPNQNRRSSLHKPVGLRNLGNTCYVNSALQCLFWCRPFRQLLYKAQTGGSYAAGGPRTLQLVRKLFLEMQMGPFMVLDTRCLAEHLQLDPAYQQDGQEFMKLLLTRLEEQLAAEARSVLRELFRGHTSWRTTCLDCGQQSSSSAGRQPFYELEVPVQGCRNLKAALASILSPEHLQGGNQYRCEWCGKKVDATRQQCLHRTPPYLRLSLQRFVFDFQTMSKKKVSDPFGFPMTLDMQPFLAGDAHAATPAAAEAAAGASHDSCCEYELAGILTHKGMAASHGHYVAFVMDEDTGQWLRFDDEEVASMGTRPFGSRSAANGQDAAARPPSGRPAKKPRRGAARGTGVAAASPNDAPGAAAQLAEQGGLSVSAGSEITSRDAYLLVYRRRDAAAAAASAAAAAELRPESSAAAAEGDPHDGSPPLGGEIAERLRDKLRRAGLNGVGAGGPSSAECAGGVSDSAAGGVPTVELLLRMMADVPEDAQSMLLAAWSGFEEACKEHAVKAQAAAAKLQERRQLVRNVVASCPVPGEAEGAHWIDANWLLGFVNGMEEDVPPIDNSSGVSERGVLDPRKAAALKRISCQAWHTLEQLHGGGPVLEEAAMDMQAAQQLLQEIAGADDEEAARSRALALATALLAHPMPSASSHEALLDLELDGCCQLQEELQVGGPWYYVSRPWLQSWKARAGRSAGKTSPVAACTCKHSRLHPASFRAHNRRLAVPAALWSFLRQQWLDSQSAGAGGRGAAGQSEEESPDGCEAVAAGGPEDAAGAGAGPRASDKQAAVLEGLLVGEAQPCGECRSQADKVAEQENEVKAARALLRAQLGRLSSGSVLALAAGQRYCAVPNPWVQQWRLWVNQTVKDAAPPPSLRAAMLAVLGCTAADAGEESGGAAPRDVAAAPEPEAAPSGSGAARRLAVAAPRVVQKRGRWVQAHSEHEPLVLVEEQEWQVLAGFYLGNGSAPSAPPAAGLQPIYAWLQVQAREQQPPPQPEAEAATPCREGGAQATDAACDVKEEDAEREDDESPAASGSRQLMEAVVVTEPAVDPQQVEAARAAARRARLGYEEAEVVLELATGEQLRAAQLQLGMPADVSGATAPQAGGEHGAEGVNAAAPTPSRRSRRSRKGRAAVRIRSSDTVAALKLQVFQALEVHPLNADLYLRGRLLADNQATLVAAEVMPDDHILVVHQGRVDDDDLSLIDLPAAHPSSRARTVEAERGFANTGLLGSVSSPVVLDDSP